MSALPPDTLRLVERACQGDADAFARLADEHYRTVYGVAFSTVGNWSAAEDIAQETFLLAWTRRESLRDAFAFPAWLRRIAANLSINWLRSRDYRRRLADRYHDSASPETPPDARPDAHVDEGLRRAEVWQALDELPPHMRQVIVLYYLHGESLRGVAVALGITENAAKKRLQHGREKLRAHFERQWQDEMTRAGASMRTGSARERFLAGLALGPAVPELSRTATAGGFGFWWETAKPAAYVQKALMGGVAMTAKKTAATGIVLILALAIAYWASTRRDTPFADLRPLPSPTVAVTALAEPVAPEVEPVARPGAVFVPESAPILPEVVPATSAPAPGDSTHSAGEPVVPGVIPDPKDYAWIEGVALDETGAPVEGAEITVAALGLNAAPPEPNPDRARVYANAYLRSVGDRNHYYSGVSDSAGAFLVKGIRFAGVALVSAHAPERLAAIVTVELKPATRPDPLVLKLRPGVTLHGRLLSSSGEPVSDATLRLVGLATETGTRGGIVGLAFPTDSAGAFELTIEAPGAISLLANSPTHGSASFVNVETSPDEEILLQYQAGAVVFGRVTDDSAQPVPGVEVRLTGQLTTQRTRPDGTLAGSASGPGAEYRAVTAADGSYRIDGVDSGQSYTSAVFGSDESQLAEGPALSDLEPDERFKLDFAVQPRMTVRGTVLGSTSRRPLAGVRVTAAVVPATAASPRTDASAETRRDGSYELVITGPGGDFEIAPAFRLSPVRMSDSRNPYAKPLTLEPGDSVTLDLDMADPVRRSFLLRDVDDQPVAGANVGVQTRSENGTIGQGGSLTTDGEGRITLDALPSDCEVTAEFYKSGYLTARSRPLVSQAGDVLPEETVVIYRPADIAVALLGPDEQPLANQEIHVEAVCDGEAPVNAIGQTNGDGRLSVFGELPAADVVLTFYAQKDPSDSDFSLTSAPTRATLVPDITNDLGTVALRGAVP